ncbi:MAG TPA: hydantoinase/oxoprolinase family protein [Beijerinckiaceae bacterium]|nr:hydantoinase/oxoprolinase family protein [Beijerinckiaceae bacterium]
MAQHRVTVDTGGTFSDFVFFDEDTGRISVAKIASTPEDPSRAILAGVELLIAQGVAPHDIGYFCHGTTVGTNALLEGKGARTGLLVTRGFRGIYEVGEQARPHGHVIFDIMYDRPPMLAPPSRTGEASERVSSAGQVLQELDEAALRATLRDLRSEGVESMAVCFLFSFLAPQHERRARELIAEEIPGCGVSLSCEIAPQIREYYRLSTTVVNAYLQPILARYIDGLDQRLRHAGVVTPQKYVMQSNGGMSTFAATAKKAVATVLSGPAGGVTASVHASRAAGFANVVTFDMGGTSCDVSLIKDFEPLVTSRGKVEGRDIALPMIDINTVSAGGGTLARVDQFGELVVGPQSAGALPGPACYGRGGAQPTVTDCNLVLGYLSPRNFLGGAMTLDEQASHRALQQALATPLGMDAVAAAEGVVRIINVKMQEAIKSISTMRGHDLRDFRLLAFGGAGPLHAAGIAAELGMASVVIPPHPGVYSALGLLMSDVKHDYVRSRLVDLSRTSEQEVNASFADLGEQARRDLLDEGFSSEQIEIDHALDLRYAGQGYEMTLPYSFPLQAGELAALRRQFDERHQSSFGHMASGEAVEIVSWRVRGVGRTPPVTTPTYQPCGLRLEDAVRETRSARFHGRMYECKVYQRERLDVGTSFPGPAIVDQLDCTSVIAPGQVASVDVYKNLIIDLGGR